MKAWRPIALSMLCVAGAGAIAVFGTRTAPPAAPTAPTGAAVHEPSLFCEFYDFMHKTVVASFDFGVGTKNHLLLRAQILPDGARTTFSGDERAAWSAATEDDTPALIAPDGDTRILLYGLKPGAGGVLWSEAGVRSTTTRNLEGRCRQAYLDRAEIAFAAPATNKERSR